MTHTINVALIGQRFMGRAHANAYRQVRAFFDPALVPRLRLACGRNAETLTDFAHRFGWEEHTTDWHNAVTRDDIDLVDICVSNDLHAEIALAAAQAGKAVFCEKPLGRDLAEARRMLATEPNHPYASAWWPPGHILGYEHSFVHAVYELITAIAEGRNPEPNFYDGVRAQAVLEAVSRSVETRSWVQAEE